MLEQHHHSVPPAIAPNILANSVASTASRFIHPLWYALLGADYE